jgi:transposase-like protein
MAKRKVDAKLVAKKLVGMVAYHVTSKEISALLKELGHDVSPQTIAAYKAWHA